MCAIAAEASLSEVLKAGKAKDAEAEVEVAEEDEDKVGLTMVVHPLI